MVSMRCRAHTKHYTNIAHRIACGAFILKWVLYEKVRRHMVCDFLCMFLFCVIDLLCVRYGIWKTRQHTLLHRKLAVSQRKLARSGSRRQRNDDDGHLDNVQQSCAAHIQVLVYENENKEECLLAVVTGRLA